VCSFFVFVFLFPPTSDSDFSYSLHALVLSERFTYSRYLFSPRLLRAVRRVITKRENIPTLRKSFANERRRPIKSSSTFVFFDNKFRQLYSPNGHTDSNDNAFWNQMVRFFFIVIVFIVAQKHNDYIRKGIHETV